MRGQHLCRTGEHLERTDRVERLHSVEGDDAHGSTGHALIIVFRRCGVNDTPPTNQDIVRVHSGAIYLYDGPTITERTHVDVRIGVTQAPRELTVELADDVDREALKTKVEAALSGAVDVLWLTDRRNREIGVCSSKIAYVEIGTPDGERKIGFGG